MDVAIIKRDPTKPLLDDNKITAILRLSVTEDCINLTDYTSKHTCLVFDVTTKCKAILEYVRQLGVVANELDIHIDLLDWLLTPRYTKPNIKDTFPEMEYRPDKKEFTGYYENRPYIIDLHDGILRHYISILDSYRKGCAGNIYPLDYADDSEIEVEVLGFLNTHGYEISKAIYDQCEYVANFNLLDQPLNILPTEICTFQFIHNENTIRNMVHLQNKVGHIAYVGGLTFGKVRDMDSQLNYDDSAFRVNGTRITNDRIKCEESTFRSYIKEVLGTRGLDTGKDDYELFDALINVMKPYITGKMMPVITSGSQNELIKGDNMTTNETTTRNETMNLENLKWLLLYIMDTDLLGRVAHGLPVYLYRDKKHGVSAIFNYWRAIPCNENGYDESYIDFVERYAVFNMIIVTDIMAKLDDVDLDAYAKYIGGEPNIRVIVNGNVYREE